MNTADKQSRLVTGLFRNRSSAERAWQHATSRGYGKDDINVVMSDDTRQRYFNGPAETELGSKAGEGAGIGAGVGGALGAALAAVAAMGTTLVLPGLGIVVAGPLAAALAGAGAGGVAGGLVGALIGAGIPEERVKPYEEGIRGGGILMGVHARNAADAAEIERDWKDSEGRRWRRHHGRRPGRRGRRFAGRRARHGGWRRDRRRGRRLRGQGHGGSRQSQSGGR
jgi:hypothetical protein